MKNEPEFIQRKANKGRNEELEKLRNELGEIGGVVHYFGDDSHDTREEMEEKELKKVLQLLALGEKIINLKETEFRAILNELYEKKRRETQKKFCYDQNLNVAEAGWTIQFQTARKDFGGDGKYFHLWLERNGKK